MKHYFILLLIGLFASASLASAASSESLQGDALYQHGQGNVADYPQALAYFLSAAEQGDPNAQFYAGRMYQLGDGTAVDAVKAVYWYEKAGQNGDARAYNNLGNIYAEGAEGIAQDSQRALEFYQAASEMGMAMGAYNVGIVYHHGRMGVAKDYAKALHYYQRAAALLPQYAAVWNNMGILFEEGTQGVPPDIHAAERAFIQAVKLKNADAMFNLADLHQRHSGPERAKLVKELLQVASELGQREASYRLGWMYANADGVEKDEELAVRYYRRAAEAGSSSAQNNLANLLVATGREAEDAQVVVSLWEAAAAAGNLNAMNTLGYRIVDGEIPGRAPAEGLGYLFAAAEGGHLRALQNLKDYLENERLRQLVSDVQAEWVKARIKALRSKATAAAKEALAGIAADVREKRYAEALAQLDAQVPEWRQSIHEWKEAYLWALWADAQRGTGRADPDWSWRLFQWLALRYDEGMPLSFDNLMARHNAGKALLESGRIGQLHALADQTASRLHQENWLDIDKLFANAYTADGVIDKEVVPLRFVFNSAHETNPEVPKLSWIQDAHILSLLLIAQERMLSADWEKALFLCDWSDAWAKALLNNDDREPPARLKRVVPDTANDALLVRARLLEYRQENEQAEALYQRIIDSGVRSYRERNLDDARTRLALLQARSGRAAQLDVAELEQLAQSRAGNSFDVDEGAQLVHLARAFALYAQGEHAAAQTLVGEAIAFGREKNRPFLLLEALQTGAELALQGRDYAVAEALLFEALEVARRQGLKVAEPTLYALYVDCLEGSGQLRAAFQMQSRLIELLNGLGIDRPLAAAEARRLTLYGNILAGSPNGAVASKESTSPEHPAGAPAGVWKGEAAADGQSHPPADFSFDLQPLRIISMPFSERAAEAIFALSNLGPNSDTFTLSATANTDFSFYPSQTLAETLLLLNAGAGETGGAESVTLVLGGGEQHLIRVRAERDATQAAVHVQLTAQHGGTQVSAELQIHRDGEDSGTAIIDAHLIEDNPFYLVPVFHHIANADPNVAKVVALRTVASAPTRVEAYDAEGNLLFVDAEGNGRFTDPGDLLATRSISDDAFPLIAIDGAESLIEFRYRVHTPKAGQQVSVDIQRRETVQAAEWYSDAVDRIAPSPL